MIAIASHRRRDQCFNAAASSREAVITPMQLAVLHHRDKGLRSRAISAATSMMVSSAFGGRHVAQVLGQHVAHLLAAELSAHRSAIDSLSTPASDGSSCTYRGTMKRTTCDAGVPRRAAGVSVTTMPGQPMLGQCARGLERIGVDGDHREVLGDVALRAYLNDTAGSHSRTVLATKDFTPPRPDRVGPGAGAE